ncbi:MAG: GNAT family N-acetyltransferase [Tannerellaceae bacterium]|jgi:ribosomal protein S18 acetylase RimI-like enzyme|nr:GNAT family N-acetyltransferase [Tannerellaceae bacterium]
MNNTNIIHCNYFVQEHRQAIAQLINMYIADEMGGGESLSAEQQSTLLDRLENHPKTIVLLAIADDTFAGLLIGFENISTFTALPMINIHDVYVRPEYRGFRLGRQLMDGIIEEGRKRGCSRISLEVRFDNAPAQKLYRSLGFIPCEPDMHYWRKYL